MQLLWLQYFQTVAQYQSMVKASQIHCVPQPAMSATIKRLENELGVSLFDRTGNRLTLNEQGHRFYQYVTRSLDALQDAISAVSDDRVSPCGKVRLLAIEKRNLIMDQIALFMKSHPKVEFRFDTTLPQMPSSQKYDLCIAAQCNLPGFNACTPLAEDTICVAVPATHPLATQTEAEPADLCQQPFALLPESYSLTSLALDAFKHQGLELRQTVICSDSYSIRQFVERGAALAFAPYQLEGGAFSDKVRLLHIRGMNIRRTTYVFWDDEKFMSLAVRAFLDLLRAEVNLHPSMLPGYSTFGTTV